MQFSHLNAVIIFILFLSIFKSNAVQRRVLVKAIKSDIHEGMLSIYTTLARRIMSVSITCITHFSILTQR